jgi:hypothetical protein
LFLISHGEQTLCGDSNDSDLLIGASDTVQVDAFSDAKKNKVLKNSLSLSNAVVGHLHRKHGFLVGYIGCANRQDFLTVWDEDISHGTMESAPREITGFGISGAVANRR